MKFLQHDVFTNELRSLERRQRQLSKGLSSLKKLLERHFDPLNPVAVIVKYIG